jgi:low temperature requirement protein LtrA
LLVPEGSFPPKARGSLRHEEAGLPRPSIANPRPPVKVVAPARLDATAPTGFAGTIAHMAEKSPSKRKRRVIRPPRLHTEERPREHEVRSVELFFDLVFGVAVAQLATLLAADMNPAGLGWFVLVGVVIAWVWAGFTVYNDRFGADDVSHRLLTLLSMFPGIGMAIGMVTIPTDRIMPFVFSYVASRVLLIYLWLWAGRHNPPAQPLTHRYAIGFSIAAAGWLLAAFLPPPLRYVVLVAALVVDLVTPLATQRQQTDLPPLSTEHLVDRFGTFVLIVLGELVLVAVQTMSRQRTPTPADLTAGGLALLLAFGLWWIYFDHVAGLEIREGPWWTTAWMYLHIPLFVAMTALGAGVLTFVTRGEAVLPEVVRVIMCGAVAVIYVVAGLAEWVLEPKLQSPVREQRIGVLHGIPAVLAVILGVLGTGLAPIPLLAALTAITAMVVAVGQLWRVRLRGEAV